MCGEQPSGAAANDDDVEPVARGHSAGAAVGTQVDAGELMVGHTRDCGKSRSFPSSSEKTASYSRPVIARFCVRKLGFSKGRGCSLYWRRSIASQRWALSPAVVLYTRR